MTTTETSTPAPLFGVLQPGEKTTRRFSCELPAGFVAILQRVPHSGVQIADQTATDITLENAGDSVSPFMVVFLAEQTVRAAMGAKELFSYVLDKWSK